MPRAATVEAPFTHKGAELVGVVTGLVQVLLGSGRPVLRRGETLLATRPGIDAWRNVGESNAQCLWVLRDGGDVALPWGSDRAFFHGHP